MHLLLRAWLLSLGPRAAGCRGALAAPAAAAAARAAAARLDWVCGRCSAAPARLRGSATAGAGEEGGDRQFFLKKC